MVRWTRALVLGTVAAAVAAGVWLRFGRGPEVATVRVTRGSVAEVVYATGTVEPARWAKVIPMQRKRLVELCDCEGRQVVQGEVLARQDDAEERANLTELEARRAFFEKEHTRLAGLLERNATSATAVETSETALKESAARIAAARERVDALVLRAPMDGVVLRKDFELGEIVGQNDVVFWVGQPKPLRVVADVNEEDIPRVQPGMKVLLRNDGFGARTLPATVSFITPKGDPSAKTFRVYLGLPDDTPLLIGMSVEANIVSRETQDALLAPAEAISGDVAWKVGEGRLSRAPVKVGIRGTRMVEIVDGLREGDAIVSPARPEYRDGERVRVAGGP
ncbi:efflux RND transporter periplasmic adaptor subunit [Alsobacter sp. SYSU M60028]|uniref:Efflux RND transporter periplasmic adaptor subunit n=1 Tax=Alsobacter ponti TaxID=2962936 RepID=A0ABT1LCF3_9HYPH|nr:efflux RND transporter periplasmic adaptor subunit [Alsobacter ponti]MCP8939179.1 efflux RND transporter periplasmic adaptor subunit [Alsobacter ponti]